MRKFILHLYGFLTGVIFCLIVIYTSEGIDRKEQSIKESIEEVMLDYEPPITWVEYKDIDISLGFLRFDTLYNPKYHIIINTHIVDGKLNMIVSCKLKKEE